jgi:hypothetical protein
MASVTMVAGRKPSKKFELVETAVDATALGVKRGIVTDHRRLGRAARITAFVGISNDEWI